MDKRLSESLVVEFKMNEFEQHLEGSFLGDSLSHLVVIGGKEGVFWLLLGDWTKGYLQRTGFAGLADLRCCLGQTEEIEGHAVIIHLM
jgi:hypothetical protein